MESKGAKHYGIRMTSLTRYVNGVQSTVKQSSGALADINPLLAHSSQSLCPPGASNPPPKRHGGTSPTFQLHTLLSHSPLLCVTLPCPLHLTTHPPPLPILPRPFTPFLPPLMGPKAPSIPTKGVWRERRELPHCGPE
jgi:hypothetical protein